MRRLAPLGREELGRQLGVRLSQNLACVTFHPAMIEAAAPQAQLKELFKALDAFSWLQAIFTLPNADAGADAIIKAVKAYAAKHPGRAAAYASLGVKRYLSLVKLSSVVIGNSSSGIIEAPSLKVPTVNIGDRQQGRTRPSSVIDCPARTADIVRALRKALSLTFRRNLNKPNPYGDGRSAPRIARILLKKAVGLGVKKEFYDLKHG